MQIIYINWPEAHDEHGEKNVIWNDHWRLDPSSNRQPMSNGGNDVVDEENLHSR